MQVQVQVQVYVQVQMQVQVQVKKEEQVYVQRRGLKDAGEERGGGGGGGGGAGGGGGGGGELAPLESIIPVNPFTAPALAWLRTHAPNVEFCEGFDIDGKATFHVGAHLDQLDGDASVHGIR